MSNFLQWGTSKVILFLRVMSECYMFWLTSPTSHFQKLIALLFVCQLTTAKGYLVCVDTNGVCDEPIFLNLTTWVLKQRCSWRRQNEEPTNYQIRHTSTPPHSQQRWWCKMLLGQPACLLSPELSKLLGHFLKDRRSSIHRSSVADTFVHIDIQFRPLQACTF